MTAQEESANNAAFQSQQQTDNVPAPTSPKNADVDCLANFQSTHADDANFTGSTKSLRTTSHPSVCTRDHSTSQQSYEKAAALGDFASPTRVNSDMRLLAPSAFVKNNATACNSSVIAYGESSRGCRVVSDLLSRSQVPTASSSREVSVRNNATVLRDDVPREDGAGAKTARGALEGRCGNQRRAVRTMPTLDR